MILTKNYFKKFQFFIVGGCVLAAIIVGSIQSAFIITKVKK